MSTETETPEATALHGGRLVAKRLKAHGVTKLFTLSGGHLFSIYDGCREEGIDIVDVRHEQSAGFAAEGWAKATRQPGVCALTAGPGVTNGMSALAGGAHERVADARAWRPGAGRALGDGLAPGDRPRAVRRADHEAGSHGSGHRRHPRARGRGAARLGRAAERADLHRLPDGPGLHGGAGRGRRARHAAGPDGAAGRRRKPARPRRGAAPRRREARRDGGHRALLGARGGRAARALRGAPGAGVPERARARLRRRRPPALLLTRTRSRPEGRGRGARDRRADGLPARLRRLVRRGD